MLFDFVDLSIFFLFVIIFICIYFLLRNDDVDIPGPYAWPIIGNLLLLRNVPAGKRAIYFQTLADKYGSVFRVKYGPFTVVYLYGYETIHTAFVKNGHIFSDRPNWFPGIAYELHRGKGLVYENGEKWKKIRRFALQTMRDLGVGKRSLEELILEEVRNLDSILDERNGKPITDVKEIMTIAVCNVIYSIVFGFRYHSINLQDVQDTYTNLVNIGQTRTSTNPDLGSGDMEEYTQDDTTLKDLQHTVDVLFKGSQPVSIGYMFPQSIRNLVDQNAHRVNKCRSHLYNYIDEQIKEHEKTFDGSVRDFVDLYIKSQMSEEKDDTTFLKTNMFRVIFDLFAAATETTGNTLDWVLLYLIGYPDVQQKCFDELEKHVGCNRMVTLSDRSKLTYIEAMIMEVQRLSNIDRTNDKLVMSLSTTRGAPNNLCESVLPVDSTEGHLLILGAVSSTSATLPHSTTESTSINGYVIPKGMIVLAALQSVHFDEKHWKDPYKFKPERFLHSNGKLKKDDHLICFSLGPRVCPGESLAKTEMFLIISNLIRRYTFTKVKESDILDFDGYETFTTAAVPYRLKAMRRT